MYWKLLLNSMCPQGFFPERESLLSRIENLMQYTPLTDTIEKFWLDPANKEAETWSAHRDINMVTLATSLAPDGYLEV